MSTPIVTDFIRKLDKGAQEYARMVRKTPVDSDEREAALAGSLSIMVREAVAAERKRILAICADLKRLYRCDCHAPIDAIAAAIRRETQP